MENHIYKFLLRNRNYILLFDILMKNITHCIVFKNIFNELICEELQKKNYISYINFVLVSNKELLLLILSNAVHSFTLNAITISHKQVGF